MRQSYYSKSDLSERLKSAEQIDLFEMKKKLDELKLEGAYEASCISKVHEWTSHPKTYCFYKTEGSYNYLTIGTKVEGESVNYKVYKCNRFKRLKDLEDRVDNKITGKDCNEKLQELFLKYNGVSLEKAFGRVYSKTYRYLVPKPTYYINRNYSFKEVSTAQYIDVSAMYPSCACGRLPDYSTAIQIDGYVKPNEDFPFAFYLKSNHCAEYGVFDTHDYMKLPLKYYKWQCFTDKNDKVVSIYNTVKPEEEITVLMQASDYEMTAVMEELFNLKLSGDKLAKAFMNIGIGTLHKNPKNYSKDAEMYDYYHVAAIILGRANKKQYDKIKEIERQGYTVIQTIVDSIIYDGDTLLGIEDKVLGEYYNEFHQTVNLRQAGINRYVIYDNNRNLLKCVISGVEEEEQNVKVPEDIDKYGEEG